MESSSQEFIVDFDDNNSFDRKMSVTPYLKPKRKRMSEEQTKTLMAAFLHTPKPSATLRIKLAVELGLTARAVQIWFQNRRARQKVLNTTMGTSDAPESVSSPNLPSNEMPSSSSLVSSSPFFNVHPNHQQNYGMPPPAGECEGYEVEDRKYQAHRTVPHECPDHSSVPPSTFEGTPVPKALLECNTNNFSAFTDSLNTSLPTGTTAVLSSPTSINPTAKQNNHNSNLYIHSNFQQPPSPQSSQHQQNHHHATNTTLNAIRPSIFPVKDLLLSSVQDSALDLSADAHRFQDKFSPFDFRAGLLPSSAGGFSSQLPPLLEGNLSNVLPSFTDLRPGSGHGQSILKLDQEKQPGTLIHDAEEDTPTTHNPFDWSDIVWSSLDTEFTNFLLPGGSL